MDERVLSEKDCVDILDVLMTLDEDVTNYCNSITESIDTFKKVPVSRSFFESGSFGQEMEEELLKVQSAVSKFYDSLKESNGLIPVTKEYAEQQLNYLRKGAN